MSDALVFNVPMELCLELMPVIGSHFSNAEGKLFDNIVDERDGTGLGVALVDFEGPDAGCVVNGGVLITLDGLLVFIFEYQKLNINLNLMPRDLPLVTNGMDFAKPGATR